jgi:hypothetical protein
MNQQHRTLLGLSICIAAAVAFSTEARADREVKPAAKMKLDNCNHLALEAMGPRALQVCSAICLWRLLRRSAISCPGKSSANMLRYASEISEGLAPREKL